MQSCRGQARRRIGGFGLAAATYLIAGSACATAPRAAGPIPVAVDQRVRVTLSSRAATGALQGMVVSVSPDTLTVEREEGGLRQLTRTRIDRIEISTTRTRDPLSAAGYGILAGAPLLVPLILVAPLIAAESDASVLLIFLLPVTIFATVGVIMGGGPQDVWVDAYWPAATAPQPADSLSAPQPADSLDADGE